MKALDDFRLKFGQKEYVPIIIGGMGVDISTAELALEAVRLGGVGHISDAMNVFVSDKLYGTSFSAEKSESLLESRSSFDKSSVKFRLEVIREAQLNHVRSVMSRKQGDGLVFINVMEKLTMGAATQTMGARLNAALDGGIDGITLSAGLHMHSMSLIQKNRRLHDAKIGIIVSSARALKIFLRSAGRAGRLPDYVVVEGPLAGGHLGFGMDDWKAFSLRNIVPEVLNYLSTSGLNIPVIAAGGIFTGSDAVEYMEMGASGVQVATRFTIARECGYPDKVKQELIRSEEDDVVVSGVSPTGYPIRMIKSSPCLAARTKPQCEALGYMLDCEGKCQYIDYLRELESDGPGKDVPKICLCFHFGSYNCYTCGHYVYRLKDTTTCRDDGMYVLPTAEEIFRDYQFSKDRQ